MQDLVSHAKEYIFGSILGLIGAIVALPYHKVETPTLTDKIWFIFSGAAFAVFLTAPVTDILGSVITMKETYSGGVGFLLGACGGSLLSAIIRAIKGADLWAVIKARFGLRG